MDAQQQMRLLQLVQQQRWAALATIGGDYPEASWVAYCVAADGSVLLHLSRLASHTRNLERNARASLAISQPEQPQQNPQELARVTLFGTIQFIERDTPEYRIAQQSYIARLPEAEMLFNFADFFLMRLVPERARWVGGFAQARTLDGERLRALLAGREPGVGL